jgi:thiol-disulfide isomerase/thioredoxin
MRTPLADPIRYTLEALVFTADWCDPCFDFVPSVNRILYNLREFDKTHTVNADKDPELCSYYSVQGFPCVVFRLRTSSMPKLTFEVPRSRIVGVCDHDRVAEMAKVAIRYKRACNK